MDCPILYDVLYNANIIILMGMTIFCTRWRICPLGSAAPKGAQFAFICAYPGFHIGLCPHFTLGFAGVSPLQGSLSYWAFAVLCSLNVFGCVNGLLGSFVFLYLFDCDCVVCGIGGDCWGIDCCGRAMSPNGAILFQSPGRKPWVICYRTFIEPRRGGTSVRVLGVVVILCLLRCVLVFVWWRICSLGVWRTLRERGVCLQKSYALALREGG